MLTRLTDEDWAIVLQVFEAARSRRDDKDRDNRQLLEVLHYFSGPQRHNGARFPPSLGTGPACGTRFWRLSQSGVLETLEALPR